MERSDFFIVGRKELIYYLLSSPAISWPLWLTLGLGLVLIFTGAVCDVRVMFLGLILCLTVAPTMAFFIYFSKMLDTHIMINILPHTIEGHPGGYLVRIYRAEPLQDEDDKDKVEWIETGKMTIFDSKVVKRIDRREYSILFLVDSPVKVLYIPRGLQPLPTVCEINGLH